MDIHVAQYMHFLNFNIWKRKLTAIIGAIIWYYK